MSPDELFLICNYAVMPAWFLLFVLPHHTTPFLFANLMVGSAGQMLSLLLRLAMKRTVTLAESAAVGNWLAQHGESLSASYTYRHGVK